jgi:hypothetical protein
MVVAAPAVAVEITQLVVVVEQVEQVVREQLLWAPPHKQVEQAVREDHRAFLGFPLFMRLVEEAALMVLQIAMPVLILRCHLAQPVLVDL